MDLQSYYKDYYKNNNYALSDNKLYSRFGFIEKFINESNVPIPTLLDVGCGDAAISTISYEMEYFGLDINVDKACTKRARQHDLTQFPYPFEDKFFDLIICSEVLEHMIDPESILKEMHRLLKDDGKIFLSTPNHDWIDIKLDPFHFDVTYRTHLPHTFEHIRHYDKVSYEMLLDHAELEAIKYYGADAHFSPHLANLRKHMLEKIFQEEAEILPTGGLKQTENLQLIDMMLGEGFPINSHTLICEVQKCVSPKLVRI